MERHGHYAIDNGETYCHDENSFDARVSGDTVAVGPQPTDYCAHCCIVEPEWIEVTLEDFNRSYA